MSRGMKTVALLLLVSVVAVAQKPLFEWRAEKGTLGEGRWQSRAGKLVGRVQGDVRLVGTTLQALELDGRAASVTVSDRLSDVGMPTKALSLEAWVAVRRPQQWGGLISAIQDDGAVERGALLGFRDDRYCFAVSTRAGGKLTYLTAPSGFVPGSWHHVLGTYDGKVMRLYVDGVEVASSKEQSGPVDYPDGGWFELGAYRDANEFYRTEGLLHQVAVFDRALSASIVRRRARPLTGLPIVSASGEVPTWQVSGPLIQHVAADSVRVRYQTETPVPSVVWYGVDATKLSVVAKEAETREHEVLLPVDPLQGEYRVQIASSLRADAQRTEVFKFDASFDYRPEVIGFDPSLATRGPALAMLAQCRREGMSDRGLALVVGLEDGSLVDEILKTTRLQVVAVEEDPAKVSRLRRRWDAAGLYGRRVSVHRGSLNELPYGPFLANLVTSECPLLGGRLRGLAAEMHRVLRPSGGILALGLGASAITREQLEEWLVTMPRGEGEARWSDATTDVWTYRRGTLPGAGEWTHQYGGADNAAMSGDERVSGEMDVAWFGRPGPRPMPDRGNRNPAPLYCNGRLYVQGNRILFGMDAYNGTILWSTQVPAVRRANIIRDSSNMAAAPDALYVAQGPYCLVVDGETGEQRAVFQVPKTTKVESEVDWGYLAVVDDLLIGTATRRGARYLGDDGEWYEGIADTDVAKVVSEAVFVLDRHTGRRLWLREGGRSLNATLLVQGGRLNFLEDRVSDQGEKGRLPGKLPKALHLMGLDLRTGKVGFEQEVDLSDCRHMVYLTADESGQRLIAAGTDEKKAYQVTAFSSKDGKTLWRTTHPDNKGHHSGHLQHPVLIGDALYLNKMVLDLTNGAVRETGLLDRRGCGTMAGGRNVLVYRAHYHGMWDLKSRQRFEFTGVRGGCWLGQIPAGGLLLAPETSAGCSCTHAIQTSMAFVPRGSGPASVPSTGDVR